MEPEFTNSMSLLEFAQTGHLYQKLIAQLGKDFKMANIHLDISEDMDPDELVETVREKIYFLLMEQFPKYVNLLYVVDVSETEISDMAGSDAVEIADEVCFLVLKRVWNKVLLREKYS